jgi:hypothetical protein
MTDFTQPISLETARRLILRSIPYDDVGHQHLRILFPDRIWHEGSSELTLATLISFFKVMTSGTPECDLKRERLAGYLCGDRYGLYEDLLIALK